MSIEPIPPAESSDVPPQPYEPQSTRRLAIWNELRLWAGTLLSAAVYATIIVTFIGQIARVGGFSMTPTLEDHDRLVVNKLAYRWHKPAIGDIVMVASPHKPETMLVKRVVAGPGDVVRSVDGRVYRNDVLVPDDFVSADERSFDDWGPEVVPDGYYFVLGDHRNDSFDSRSFGPVPEKYITGKIQLRWWPIDRSRLF